MISLASFVLVLGLVVDVEAATLQWTGGGADDLWSTPENWNTGALPTAADKVRMKLSPGATIVNEGAVALDGWIGSADGADLTVDGGTLTTSSFLIFGRMAGDIGTLNMISGTLNCAGTLFAGHTGSGTINITGGTINAPNLYIPHLGEGHVNLHGGVINLTGNFLMKTPDTGLVGSLDVGGGTLVLDGNDLAIVQGYIDNGLITAYEDNGTVQLDYDVTNEGQTTLKGVHKLNPNPVNGGFAAPGAVELSWTLPDPCVAGEPVLVDVYFTDNWEALYSFADPEAIRIVSRNNMSSIVVQTQPKVKYYWAVDTYVGDPNDPIFGPIFSFLALQVYAGPDLLTWLGDDGTRAKGLDATVTDEDAYTVQWTVISEPDDPNSPDAVITDPSAEDTSITLSALGEYVLQLEAFDGEYTGSDTVTINVYNDGCEAAQSLPDYVPFPGDLNGDCKVDELDLAILEEDWLKDNSLTEP